MPKLKPHLSVQQIAKKHRLDVSFIQKQLDMGEPIEHEHTKDHNLAMNIALQHLDEIPDYYTRLKKMEASAKKEHKKFKDVVKEDADSGVDDMDSPFHAVHSIHLEYDKRYCPKCKKVQTRSECKYGPTCWDIFSIPAKLKEETMQKEQRYCPLCDKRETRSECSYGGKAWDKVSIRDHEYSMARSELDTLLKAAQRIKKKVGKGKGSLEAWVQSKITKAADYIDTAADYIDSGEMEEAANPAQQAAIAIAMKKKGVKPKSEVDEACWIGYKQEGLKKKGKKMVPNCVPTNEAKALGFEIKKSSGAGALTPDAAKQLGDKAAAVSLPKVKEEKLVDKILGELQEASKSGDSSLHDWFTKSKSSDGKPGWVQLGGKYAGKSCAKQPGQTTKPKCGSSKMAAEMSPEEEERAARRKRREDPNSERSGKAKNVATEEFVNEDACKEKVKSRYKIWPSAYASGALVKCRKVGASNWGNKKEDVNERADFWHPDPEQDRKLGGPGPNQRAREDRGQSDRKQPISPDYSNKLKPGENYMQFAKRKEAEKMKEDVTIEDANGKLQAEIIDLIKPDPMVSPKSTFMANNELEEATRLQSETGNIIAVILSWRGKTYSIRMFFPQVGMPSKKDVTAEIQKVYPGSIVLQFNVSTLQAGMPLIQVVNSKSKNYLLNNGTIGEETLDEVAAWQRKEGKNPEGGLNKKGIASYRREHPGSKLSLAVTTPPSKLKPGSKAANRRKSFCARMGGMPGPMKDEKGRPTRKALSLKKWNC